MKIYITFLALLLVLSIVVNIQAEEDGPDTGNNFEYHLLQGKDFHRQGNLDKAQDEYEHAISIKPDSDEAHFLLGYVFFKKYQRSHRAATQSYIYEQIVNSPPSQGEITDDELQRTLETYGLQPNYEKKAIKEFKRTAELNPNHYMARYHIAVDHLNNKRYEKAIIEYKVALRANPTHVISHGGLGDAYHGLGKLELAIQSYKKSIDLDDQLSMTHMDLAKVYLKIGKREKAIEILNEMEKQKHVLYESLRMVIYGQK
ncbi:MAG: tetratricopeptide repeat protein [Desulfobacteraceae bacterium]|jgi:pentatricopeptide repeat protein|nr:tetratricopeptide repeat protein [Desulfobacteraceae bacterium]